MTEQGTSIENDRRVQMPRSVRDGSLVAAIGVALTLALETNPVEKQMPDAPIESPWNGSSRIHMNFRRSGFQKQDGWGKLSGWKSAHGKWRTLK